MSIRKVIKVIKAVLGLSTNSKSSKNIHKILQHRRKRRWCGGRTIRARQARWCGKVRISKRF